MKLFYLFAIVLLFLQYNSAADCPVYNVPTGYTVVSCGSNVVGATCELACNTGYGSGSVVISPVCQANGTWSDAEGCPSRWFDNALYLEIGAINSDLFDSLLYYTCLHSFIYLVVVDCGVFVPHSSVGVRDCTGARQQYEDTCYLSCALGYKNITADTTVCQADGTWSSSPTCVGMYDRLM